MPALGAAGRQRGRAQLLEKPEQDERRDPLAVGRDLQHVVPAIRRGDEVDPVGFDVAQILFAHEGALGAQRGDDLGGNLAFVEGLGAAARDIAQCCSEGRPAMPFADAWRPAIDETVPAGALVGGQFLGIGRPTWLPTRSCTA